MNPTLPAIPYDWLKPLDPHLLQLDDIPLLGNSPTFPWDSFSHLLSQSFEVESLKIESGEVRWRTNEELKEGLGDAIQPLHLSVSAFEGRLCWLMAEEEIAWIMSALLHKTGDIAPEAIDHDILDGFYHFLALEAVHLFSRIEFDKTLTPHLLKDASFPEGPALCVDVKISLYGHTGRGRLVLSPAFQKAWKEHYAERKLATSLSTRLAQKIQLELALEGGKTLLSMEEWRALSPGDFILLDHCSLEPGEDKGRVWITLKGAPLFRAKVKAGNVKILESPLYHEVYTAMDKAPPTPHDEEHEPEDEVFEDEDENLDDEESEEENEEEGADAFAEDEEEEEEPSKEAAAPAKSKPTISPEEITVPLVIEVGRIHISVQKLLELQPGNLLDLDVKPENGVDLVVNGKCVGKGELLRVGDSLGVRVLDLG